MARRRAAPARRKTSKRLPAVDVEKSAGRKGFKASPDDPLAVLEVIGRLEVGPGRVGQRRLGPPDVVTQGRKRQRFELI